MEDFSFPTINAEHDSLCQFPFPHFASSPLWFLSSSPSNHQSPSHLRRSFSYAEDVDTCGRDALNKELDSPSNSHSKSPPALSDNKRFLHEEEEKMDLLWEDFNEELIRISCEKRAAAAALESEVRARLGGSKSTKGRGETAPVEFFGVRKLDMTRSGSVITRRRSGMIVMLRLLKKLFPVPDPRSSSRRTQHCDGEEHFVH